MPTPNRRTPSPGTPGTAAVDTLLGALQHPHLDGIRLLRAAILAIDPRIGEEVKWNAPSFRLDDHFATFKLHPPGPIQLVLHTGAKPQKPPRTFQLQDAEPLARWAAPDRCVLSLADTASARLHRDRVVNIVTQWMQQL